MLIGLISDTHDRLPIVEEAVQRFNLEKVELVLHAGDYVAPFVIPRFKGLNAKLIGVFGNNDGDRELLRKRFIECGNMEIRGDFAEINVDDVKIALVHGTEAALLKALIECGTFNVVVHGHSHKAESYFKGRTLVVNPGEACGYLSGESTIALLDTVKLEVRTLTI